MFTLIHCCLDVVLITILYFDSQVAQSYVKKFGGDKVRVLTLVKNRGKGGAVRLVRKFVDHQVIQVVVLLKDM